MVQRSDRDDASWVWCSGHVLFGEGPGIDVLVFPWINWRRWMERWTSPMTWPWMKLKKLDGWFNTNLFLAFFPKVQLQNQHHCLIFAIYHYCHLIHL